MDHPDVQHRAVADRGGGRCQQAEAAFGDHQFQPRPDRLVRAPDVAPALMMFPAKRLHHPQRGQDLVQNRHRGALPPFCLARHLSQRAAEQAGCQEQNRRHQQTDQRQGPVDLPDHVDHRDHRDDRRDQRDHPVHRQVLDRLGIGPDAVHQIGRPAPVMAGKR